MANPIRIKPKLDMSVKFSGAQGECPDSFLKQFNLMANVAAWTPQETLTYFPLYLTGIALSWWSTIPMPVDWGAVQALLIKTFSSPVDHEFPELRLHARKYDPLTESLHSYYFHKIQLCYKMDPNMAKQAIVSHILKDLPAGYNCQILGNMDITLDKLLPVLQNLDDEQCRRVTTVPVCSFSLEQVRDVVSQEMRKLKQIPSEMVATTALTGINAVSQENGETSLTNTQFRNVVCQICNKVGHSAARCYKRFSDLNSSSYRGRGYSHSRGPGNPNRGSYYGSQNQQGRGSHFNGFTQN